MAKVEGQPLPKRTPEHDEGLTPAERALMTLLELAARAYSNSTATAPEDHNQPAA